MKVKHQLINIDTEHIDKVGSIEDYTTVLNLNDVYTHVCLSYCNIPKSFYIIDDVGTQNKMLLNSTLITIDIGDYNAINFINTFVSNVLTQTGEVIVLSYESHLLKYHFTSINPISFTFFENSNLNNVLGFTESSTTSSSTDFYSDNCIDFQKYEVLYLCCDKVEGQNTSSTLGIIQSNASPSFSNLVFQSYNYIQDGVKLLNSNNSTFRFYVLSPDGSIHLHGVNYNMTLFFYKFEEDYTEKIYKLLIKIIENQNKETEETQYLSQDDNSKVNTQ